MCADRRQSKKKLILEQARILFWKKGYDRTSIRDMAGACGFEPGNIYNYFHSKEQILYEILREEVERLVASIKHLESSSASNPVERLRLLIHNSLNLALGQRLSSRLLFDTEIGHLSPSHRKKVIELRDMYDRILRGIMRDGKQTGDFADIDVELMGFCIASMIVRTRVWYSPQGRLSPHEIADSMFKLIMNGIGVRKTVQPETLMKQDDGDSSSGSGSAAAKSISAWS